jgi:hypothetical protein
MFFTVNVLQNQSEQIAMSAGPEDKILSIVFRRLKEKLGITLEEIYAATGIPPSSLCDLSAGSAQRYMSRIVRLSKYFREVHGLDYVSTDYLLTGTEDDRAELKRELEKLALEKKALENQLSFFQHLKQDKETA